MTSLNPPYTLAKVPLCIFLIVGTIANCFAYNADDGAKTVSSDGSATDTQNAVNYVAGKNADGWVLTVGSAGANYTWASALTISAPHIFTVQGASPSNRPTINLAMGGGAGVTINAVANKVITFKDFIMRDTSTGPTKKIQVNGAGLCFRISNVKFTTDYHLYFIWVGGINTTHAVGPYGLIDHCEWAMDHSASYNCVFVTGNGSIDHWGWTQPMTWGTTDCVVVEDCVFNTPAVPTGTIVDGYGGARVTVRHCRSTNFFFSMHGIQSGAHDSTLQVECYENYFYANDTTNGLPFVIWLRGGTGTFFNNTIEQSQSQLIGQGYRFTVECAESFWKSEGCPLQLFYPQDYPGRQQCGRGVVGSSEGAVPIYAWNNTTPSTYWGTYGGTGNFILEGRDRITTGAQRPNYTPLIYPHPLRGGSTPTTQLSPPANLRVISGP